MKVSKATFNWAAGNVKLTPEQRDKVWELLRQSTNSRSQLNFGVVAYYVGALLIIFAMGWFMSEKLKSFTGLEIVAIAIIYAVIFSVVGYYLHFRRGLRIPGGLLFTVAVFMAPLAIYGILKATGRMVDSEMAADPNGISALRLVENRMNDILMSLGLIAAALFTLRFVKFAFLAVPIVLGISFLTASIFLNLHGANDISRERLVWGIYGIAIVVLASVVDNLFDEDYAFWFFLNGVTMFWVFVCLDSGFSDSSEHLIFLVNIGLLALGIILRRRVFFVFGGAGVFNYISYLSGKFFQNSQLFPIAVSLAGFAIIFAGIRYYQHRAAIDAFATRLFPWRARLVRERTGG